MRIYNLIKITAGGNHAWYKTDLGFPIRKPLGVVGQFKQAEIVKKVAPLDRAKEFSWWQRLIAWVKHLFYAGNKNYN